MVERRIKHATIGEYIRSARLAKGYSQEELSELVGVSARMIRNYESGSNTPNDIRILTRLGAAFNDDAFMQFCADVYKYENIGVEEANRISKDIWTNFWQGNFISAREQSRVLESALYDMFQQEGDNNLLLPLIEAEYQLGHIAAMTATDGNPQEALAHFERMETLSIQLQDLEMKGLRFGPRSEHILWPSSLCLARTYKGDMLRRRKAPKDGHRRFERAIEVLSNVPNLNDVDPMIKGNYVQIKARAYAGLEDMRNFEYYMQQSLDLASGEQHRIWNVPLSYSLCSVYNEYSRNYMRMGSLKKSEEKLEEAEKYISGTKRWEIPILFAKGELHIRTVTKSEKSIGVDLMTIDDFRMGKEYIDKSCALARQCGQTRMDLRRNELNKYLLNRSSVYTQALRTMNE